MKSDSLFDLCEGPLDLERRLRSDGFQTVCGVDEAGRGALAGPVVAAAVVMPLACPELIGKVRDSKKLSASRREDLFEAIQSCAVSVGVGIVSPEEIDRRNILRASLEAMRIAMGRAIPDSTVGTNIRRKQPKYTRN